MLEKYTQKESKRQEIEDKKSSISRLKSRSNSRQSLDIKPKVSYTERLKQMRPKRQEYIIEPNINPDKLAPKHIALVE